MDGFMKESLHEQKLINQSWDVNSDLMPLARKLPEYHECTDYGL